MIALFSCGKENNDYRDEITGTYLGPVHYYDNFGGSNWDIATINVEKNNTMLNGVNLTGDLVGINFRFEILNTNYTITNGYFKHDSLVFIMNDSHDNFHGNYKLKKQ